MAALVKGPVSYLSDHIRTHLDPVRGAAVVSGVYLSRATIPQILGWLRCRQTINASQNHRPLWLKEKALSHISRTLPATQEFVKRTGETTATSR